MHTEQVCSFSIYKDHQEHTNLQRLKADSSTSLWKFCSHCFFGEKKIVANIKISTLYINIQTFDSLENMANWCALQNG